MTVGALCEIGVIGVGEATTLGLPQHMHHYLGFDPREFYQSAQPQWKLGIRFLWGKRPYFDFIFGDQLNTHLLGFPKAMRSIATRVRSITSASLRAR